MANSYIWRCFLLHSGIQLLHCLFLLGNHEVSLMRNSLRCSSEIPQVLFRTCKNAGVETVSVTNKHLRLLYGRQFTLKRCSYCERFTLLGNRLPQIWWAVLSRMCQPAALAKHAVQHRGHIHSFCVFWSDVCDCVRASLLLLHSGTFMWNSALHFPRCLWQSFMLLAYRV